MGEAAAEAKRDAMAKLKRNHNAMAYADGQGRSQADCSRSVLARAEKVRVSHAELPIRGEFLVYRKSDSDHRCSAHAPSV